MPKRPVTLAGTVTPSDATTPNARADREVLAPTRILDGFGAFGPPPASARAVPATFSGRATSDHPPGFYGPAEGLLAGHALVAHDRRAPPDTPAVNTRPEG